MLTIRKFLEDKTAQLLSNFRCNLAAAGSFEGSAALSVSDACLAARLKKPPAAHPLPAACCLNHTGSTARLRRVAPMSAGTIRQPRAPRGHPTNITGGALAPNNDRHQDAACVVLNSDHPAFCSRRSVFNLTVSHHATCEHDCVRMCCGQVVQFQSDGIVEVLVIHREVKEKVRHDCLPTLLLTLAVSTRRSTSPQHHLELTCTRTIVDVHNFGALRFVAMSCMRLPRSSAFKSRRPDNSRRVENITTCRVVKADKSDNRHPNPPALQRYGFSPRCPDARRQCACPRFSSARGKPRGGSRLPQPAQSLFRSA